MGKRRRDNSASSHTPPHSMRLRSQDREHTTTSTTTNDTKQRRRGSVGQNEQHRQPKQQRAKDLISELPTELLGVVFSHLPVQDIVKLPSVSSKFRAVMRGLDGRRVWQSKCFERWGVQAVDFGDGPLSGPCSTLSTSNADAEQTRTSSASTRRSTRSATSSAPVQHANASANGDNTELWMACYFSLDAVDQIRVSTFLPHALGEVEIDSANPNLLRVAPEYRREYSEDRAVFSNFPILCSSQRGLCPMIAHIPNANGQLQRVVRFSSCTYFEATIEPLSRDCLIEQERRRAIGNTNGVLDSDECLAIGVVPLGFPSTAQLPGWTPGSVGYHSDDGHLYCGEGTPNQNQNEGSDGRQYGPPFALGDTVGCGVTIGPRPRVFFTHNGQYLGTAHTFEMSHPVLFASLGVSLRSDVRFNFGGSPFAYDLRKCDWERPADKNRRAKCANNVAWIKRRLGPLKAQLGASQQQACLQNHSGSFETDSDEDDLSLWGSDPDAESDDNEQPNMERLLVLGAMLDMINNIQSNANNIVEHLHGIAAQLHLAAAHFQPESDSDNDDDNDNDNDNPGNVDDGDE